MRPSRWRFLIVLFASALLPATGLRADDDVSVPARGADELFWVPTLEQAEEMAAATGRPIFLMGYSLVGDGSTYTKASDDACTGVY